MFASSVKKICQELVTTILTRLVTDGRISNTKINDNELAQLCTSHFSMSTTRICQELVCTVLARTVADRKIAGTPRKRQPSLSLALEFPSEEIPNNESAARAQHFAHLSNTNLRRNLKRHLETTKQHWNLPLFGKDVHRVCLVNIIILFFALADHAYSLMSLIISLAFSSSSALRAMFFTFSKVSFDRGPALMHSSLSCTVVVAANKPLSATPDI